MRPNLSRKVSLVGSNKFERTSDNFVQEFQILLSDKKFKSDLDSIKQKWDAREPLKKSVPKFLKKYKLSEKYEWAIMTFLIRGNVTKSDSPRSVEFYINEKRDYADIKVYPYSTLEDIKRAYSYIIKELKPGKIKRARNAEQFDRDRYIYELKEKGLTNKEILSSVTQKYGGRLDLGNIGRAISKIKKKIEDSKSNR